MHIVDFCKIKFGVAELNEIKKVLRSGQLTQAGFVKKFEDVFANYIGVREAVAVSSGTMGLQLVLAAYNIKHCDVILPSFTYVATANAVLHQNATPVFADICSDTFNLSPDDAKQRLTKHTKAIIAVHYAGQTADMDALREIAVEHDLILIEDAAEAPGAMYKGKHAGRLGDAAVFSFTPLKNITTGEGGMITTNDREIAAKLRILRNQGLRNNVQIEIGFSARTTEFQAALGIQQLKKLNGAIKKRNSIASIYNENLAGTIVQPPFVAPYTTVHAYTFYTITIPAKHRNRLRNFLHARGIETQIYFQPVHKQPVHKNLKIHLPVTEKITSAVVCLPISQHMSMKSVHYVCAKIQEFLKNLKKHF